MSNTIASDDLPELVVPITTTLVVTGALASRDFYPAHHDRAFAQDVGMKDVFMNIMTTTGLVGRFVTDWSGPDATLTRLSLRLGVPNYPGDVMRLNGRVVMNVTEGDVRRVTVDVTAKNALGEHCRGQVELTIPE